MPRVELDSGAAGIQTHDLLIATPASYHYTSKPHYFTIAEGKIWGIHLSQVYLEKWPLICVTF